MVPAVVVIIVWTVASTLACVGAAVLGVVAFRDWRIVSADTRDMRRRVVRRETSGILIRSGLVRAVTTALFVWAGLAGAAENRPVPIATAIVSGGLAILTALITLRDLIARKRIAESS